MTLKLSRRISKQFLLFVSSFLLIASEAKSQNKLEFIFDDWHVFTTSQDNEKVCYMATLPKESDGNFQKRSDPYFWVSSFKDHSPEVNISPGYVIKLGSKVEITIDNSEKFYLNIVKNNDAWASNEEMDSQIILALKNSRSVEVKAVSDTGYSIDIYSLAGFNRAYNKMLQICDRKE